MNVDDFHDFIDGDPELNETVDQMLDRLRSQTVVKLDYYKKQVQQYKGWKPDSLEDFVAKLHLSDKQKIEYELEKARKATNKRIKRQYGLGDK